MNQNCDMNANDIKKLEDRIVKLEQYREKDKEQLYNLDKQVSYFISELKHISSYKDEAVNKSYEQEKKIESIKNKLQEETTGKDAKKYNDIIKYILTTILGLIIGYIFLVLGLK